ncbi:MAG: MOSC domain-containing protein [Gemmatimonadetes bacterium]|jgi:hypothetical protein|nr:MOSC domain-containing protein [Gemmatimonadota bacterium]MBT5060387.1 MOSC domain-containing protein [Gemmatimonadota bacterium]MBT5146042.1 MOSC domain-containing protein [Gemmatimonadota bacterium]MBT5591879.1 MOSC domain-containing protein [Gemmatimonadota bacterium]MBT5961554.1 MOSC domain-containing protein [Gemmatimonadota bacterium]
MAAKHLTTAELESGLPEIRQSPNNDGELQLISRRPAIGERDLIETGELDTTQGLVGDDWSTRGQHQTPPRDPKPDAQLTLMNARAAQLVSGSKERWALAGDQLYVDFDIGRDNLPIGSRVQIGDAIVEVTAEPHPGCKKFVERFGMDAMTFVNSEEGKQMCLRGINTKIVQSGAIRVGDKINKA